MKKYPTYSSSKSDSEKGITLLKSFVENQLNWIFRVNHQEHDFGIDCYIDIVKDRKYVTGKTLAVQVKTGESFFKEKNNEGFVFRGELKHFGSDSQVLIV